MARGESEPTISFHVSPYLLTLEGASVTLALLLEMLYKDTALDRGSWGVSHNAANRQSFASELRAAGTTRRRLGISATTRAAVEVIQRRALGLKVTCQVLRADVDAQE